MLAVDDIPDEIADIWKDIEHWVIQHYCSIYVKFYYVLLRFVHHEQCVKCPCLVLCLKCTGNKVFFQEISYIFL
jgi:hypothetical protein